ncbi:MAG: hemerythrin domain-containing protein [Frankia sp.]
MTTKANDRTPPTDTVDFTMMYVAHAAFTRDLRRLSLTAGLGEAAAPSARARWARFIRQLHLHHRTEDAALWPLLRKAPLTPGEVAVLDAMEAEHASIDPLLAQVEDALDVVDAAGLRAGVRDLTAHLTTHMRHEEEAALPLVKSHLGPDGWAMFGAAIRKEQGMRGAAEFFPWLLDDAPEHDRAAVLGMLPPPVRMLYRLVWAPRYRKAVPADATG